MTNETQDRLVGLQDRLIDKLIERIESGEATAADFNVVRQFLKDNHIDTTTRATPKLDALKQQMILPKFDESSEHSVN